MVMKLLAYKLLWHEHHVYFLQQKCIKTKKSFGKIIMSVENLRGNNYCDIFSQI